MPLDVCAAGLVEFVQKMGIEPVSRFGIVSGHDRQTPVSPSLTAVTIPEREWGEQAAELVVAMVRAGIRQTDDVLLRPRGIVERESTAGVAAEDSFLQDAVAYIRDHADHPLSVEDVCGAIPLGRRALERRFRDELDRTILQEIHRAHVERSKMLLIDTDYAMQRVAVESGFSGVHHLMRLFKKHEQTTPGAYRKQFRQT